MPGAGTVDIPLPGINPDLQRPIIAGKRSHYRPLCTVDLMRLSRLRLELAMIAIRPAAAADIPLILQFIRDLATYERLLPEVEATEGRLRATLFPLHGRPAAECLLAFWRGQPAGFAVFFHNYSTFLARPGLYLEDLFVEPALRGRGIGRALWESCAKLANVRGCGRMEWAVLDWNQPAREFYRKLGAVEMDQWRICRLTGPPLTRCA